MSSHGLNTKFESLGGLEQLACQLLAIAFDTVDLPDLTKMVRHALPCLSQAGKPTPPKVTQTILKPVLKRLQDTGYIQSQSNLRFHILPSVADAVLRSSIHEGTFSELLVTVNTFATHHRFPWRQIYQSEKQKNQRLAFYQGDVESYFELVPDEAIQTRKLGLLTPFDETVYEGLPIELQDAYWPVFGPSLLHTANGSTGMMDHVEAWLKRSSPDDEVAISVGTDLLFAAGRCSTLQPLAELLKKQRPEILGLVCLLQGDRDQAIQQFATAMPAASLGKSSSSTACQTFAGLYYALLLLRQSNPQATATAEKIIQRRIKKLDQDLLLGCDAVLSGCDFLKDPGLIQHIQVSWTDDASRPLATLLSGYVREICSSAENAASALKNLAKVSKLYRTSGLDWLAAEAMTLANELKPNQSTKKTIEKLYNATGTSPMAGQFERTPIWKKQLGALQAFAASYQPASSPAKQTGPATPRESDRLAWLVTIAANGHHLDCRPVHQSYGKKGWSKGRPIALERIYDPSRLTEFDFLKPADRKICGSLRCDTSRDRYGYTEYRYYFETALLVDALVDHPCLFMDDDSRSPIEIEKGQARLVVEQSSEGGATISLSPRPTSRDCHLLVHRESTSKFSIVQFSDAQLKLASMLSDGLTVPDSAVDQLLDAVRPLAPIAPLHSEIEVAAEGAEQVVADNAIHAHLTPYDQGLQIAFFTRPFGDSGGFFVPGQGSRTVVTKIDGQMRSTRRDLEAEIESLRAVQNDCDFLGEQAGADVIDLPTAAEALEALLELESLVEESRLTLHWPKGQSFQIAGSADESDWKIKINGGQDWFAASGQLHVDSKLAIEMKDLLEMASTSTSRFVQLNDGRFVALTEHFRKRLETMAAYTDRRQNEVRFPTIRTTAIAELTGNADLTADQQWKSQIKRIESADRVRPKVPKTLNAELRDYQVDGFKWMSRLAHLGAGACLADDMGLGKTLQCLAVLLNRGKSGPALVVAPTSVAANWVSEIARFAPSLRPILFSEADRETVVKSLGKRDLLICSYGLLANEAQKLQSRRWQTLVLDEAQAIKNAETKRSEAAMGLEADFRIVLTGTPMENHLGELWNLFQFINPGLLGSSESFQERFAIPIERDHRRDVQRQLKQLIAPFILRRTKSQVLDELPPRTEITVPIELGENEAAMYEAIRQKALQNLEDSDDDRPMHIKILAELMRLRRFCCHPDLVDPNAGLEAAKLERFTETVTDLIAGGHKVLVFSQFVGHLQLLRDRLDERKISYQYLDGSTPAKKRKTSVDAFQDGEGDAFLISLKAGGVGLNLTAADYVIHMDPWWNPAVEDQASDRAHRMGQQRPVTVYRFITTGTIEERILQLHESKRDLADSLLEGTESSAKLSAEELMKLIL
ncbi:SWF/SNF family helicase [Rhodopirellula bahusiensis]|uniref:SWF/SNF family helicase n=1 Tax=Rhodopirellula bahusiensis TaxID=2014065 RepID=A0A2G1WB65_9BACT|nr:SWF/SNF family helicase [Rhodopirellula bahusiensis]